MTPTTTLPQGDWTIHWLKNASAEVEIYLYIELHKASLLTGKDFFDDPKGPLLACIGKIKDVELDSAGKLRDEPSLAKQSDSADLPVGQMYLVVGLLIQGEHSVTPSLYELVDDIKHAGDNGPMAVTHTNAEWLAMIETWRFRDLLRRASIKLMNAIGTARARRNSNC
eukprot:jgi/Tetstr1/453730/TSEL_003989.t1